MGRMTTHPGPQHPHTALVLPACAWPPPHLSLQLDLLVSFGNPMLRHCEQRLVPQHSCLLALLMAAALGRTPAIRHCADEALRWAPGRPSAPRLAPSF